MLGVPNTSRRRSSSSAVDEPTAGAGRFAPVVEYRTIRYARRFRKIMPYVPYRGNPRTPGEWAALASIASGRTNVSRDALRELFVLGLVDRVLGRVCLSEHGRAILGATQEAMAD